MIELSMGKAMGIDSSDLVNWKQLRLIFLFFFYFLIDFRRFSAFYSTLSLSAYLFLPPSNSNVVGFLAPGMLISNAIITCMLE